MLRKGISILMSVLVLFNALGFYGLFIGLEYSNELSQHRLFNNDSYDRSLEISIKVPLAVPYALDQSDYERVDGDFEYNGEFYRLVKQKLSHDTLHIICVRDFDSKKIHLALQDYVKTFTDKHPEGKTSAKTSLNFLKDYFQPQFSIIKLSTGWSSDVEVNTSLQNFTPDYFHDIVHPPERC